MTPRRPFGPSPELDQSKFGSELQDDAAVAVGPVKKIINAALDALRVSDGDW